MRAVYVCLEPPHVLKPFYSSSNTLHYDDYPLHIVRGQGQYFYDENDQKYLDTTNNVACGKYTMTSIYRILQNVWNQFSLGLEGLVIILW